MCFNGCDSFGSFREVGMHCLLFDVSISQAGKTFIHKSSLTLQNCSNFTKNLIFAVIKHLS